MKCSQNVNIDNSSNYVLIVEIRKQNTLKVTRRFARVSDHDQMSPKRSHYSIMFYEVTLLRYFAGAPRVQ